jgi:hypothetical protein
LPASGLFQQAYLCYFSILCHQLKVQSLS